VQFVADLKKEDEKIGWAEIAERVKAKFPKVGKVSLTANAIRKRYNAWLMESEGSKKSDSKKQGEIITPQVKEQLRQELMEGVRAYIEECLKGVVEGICIEVSERVFQERFSNFQNLTREVSPELYEYPPSPPLPETVEGTRRHTVARGKLAGTVDAALLELFESERKKRGYNVSRMLDVVLWNYFAIGKPTKPSLSFERKYKDENSGGSDAPEPPNAPDDSTFVPHS